MLHIILLMDCYHVFFDNKLLFIQPFIPVQSFDVPMSSACYTYLVCVEPKLFELGLINRASMDASESCK